MGYSLAVEDVIESLRRRFGKPVSFGRSRLFKFGSALACSINYSKLLGGHKYFFGLAKEVVDQHYRYPETKHGDFVLLVCGSSEKVFVLPRAIIIEMMKGVATRKIDLFFENGAYVLQTTQHPKLNVTEFLNAYPKVQARDTERPEEEKAETPDRVHLKIQAALIKLGRAEGCSVWVPPGDRNLSYKQEPFSINTLERLPSFGFNENTRRIVQNIDVLWLSKNIIHKAFEIESTTSIYSGLLRLNDLVLAQPNNQIDLFVTAAMSRREKVFNQLLRPSFQEFAPRCFFLCFEEVESCLHRLDALGSGKGTRVSGLIRGEHFEIPEHFLYPSGI